MVHAKPSVTQISADMIAHKVQDVNLWLEHIFTNFFYNIGISNTVCLLFCFVYNKYIFI